MALPCWCWYVSVQALAIVDTLYLASCVAIQSVKTVHDLTDWAPGQSALRRSFPYVEPHAWALASIAQTSTVWLVLLVTFDRYGILDGLCYILGFKEVTIRSSPLM